MNISKSYSLLLSLSFIGPLIFAILIQYSSFLNFSYGLLSVISFIITIVEIKSTITIINYFEEHRYKFTIRISQFIYSLYALMSLIIFLKNDTYLDNNNDKIVNTIFHYFCLIYMTIIELFIRINNNSNRIIPQSQSNQENEIIDIRINPIESQNELILIKDKLKGIILDQSKEFLTDCSICLDKDNQDENIIILNCSHKFHYNCLNNCYKNKIIKCPLCRLTYI